jgi:hypothetical protein
MKRILLVILVLFGLNQTQAQMNVCDSMTNTGSHFQPTISLNNINTIIDYWITTAPDGTVLGEDSLTNYHTAYNYNPMGSPYDTITTCITWGMGATNTCCVTWIWDANMWLKMSMQQPYFCCDSITYWTDQSQGFNIGLDTSGIVHNPDSIDVWWSVCTNGMCYAGDGMYDYFPQVTTSDTLKVGYDVYIYENGVLVEVCTMEDWLVFDGTNWVLFNNTPTSINEITFNKINDNKIYDLLGREVTEMNIGQMYIRNNKKYIRVK